MPLHTTEAVVLRTYPLAETDRIVVLLTQGRGKKRGVARGAQRSRRRFGGALEPLTRVRAAYVERENRELVTLTFAEPLESPMRASDPQAPGHAAYFAELIDDWAPQDHPNERLFRLAAATVGAMAAGAAVVPLARYFEYWMLRLEGVYPSLSGCAACRRPLAGGAALAADADALLCPTCAPRVEPRVSALALRFLRSAGTRPPGAPEVSGTPAPVLRELERLHRALLARHLDREPRSARVLRAMEASLAARDLRPTQDPS
jgi:DNA repair protein RecO (recombination protein O)